MTYHAVSQNDLPVDMQILNISVNMARIANWTEGLFGLKKEKGEQIYRSRLKLIRRMISQTDSYLNDLTPQNTSAKFKLTLSRFQQEFKIIRRQRITIQNHLLWAEKALTWANILQHRAKLA